MYSHTFPVTARERTPSGRTEDSAVDTVSLLLSEDKVFMIQFNKIAL